MEKLDESALEEGAFDEGALEEDTLEKGALEEGANVGKSDEQVNKSAEVYCCDSCGLEEQENVKIWKFSYGLLEEYYCWNCGLEKLENARDK